MNISQILYGTLVLEKIKKGNREGFKFSYKVSYVYEEIFQNTHFTVMGQRKEGKI